MQKFLYSAFLPSLNKTISLTEVSFSDYKQLTKLILNNNDEHIVTAFNEIITTTCKDSINDITFLDKLIILLTIRAVCVSPFLELIIKHPETEKPNNITFNILDVVDKIDKLSLFAELNNITVKYLNDIEITYGIPDEFFFTKREDAIISTIRKIHINNVDVTENKNELVELLPASVFRDAREHINKINDRINELTLLSVIFSPTDDNKNIKITTDLFSNSVLEFLKLCFKRDLTSMYELEYYLSSKLKIPYELISNSTLAELTIYINLYKEEQAAKEKAEKQATRNPNPLAARTG
jgi:hypothetical protein